MFNSQNIRSNSIFDTGLDLFDYKVEGAQTLEDASKHLVLAAYAINKLAMENKLDMPNYSRLMRTFIYHHDARIIGLMDNADQRRRIFRDLDRLANLFY